MRSKTSLDILDDRVYAVYIWMNDSTIGQNA